MSQISQWYPDNPPIYDISKSYMENALHGPFFAGDIPQRIFPPKEKWIPFLGYHIASPLGVAAGPLLNSKFTHLASQLGFDLVTYKTIRSKEKHAHPLPNIVFVDTGNHLEEPQTPLLQRSTPGVTMNHLAITNSFGMGCADPTLYMKDIALAKSQLAEGQLLNVSIVGTPDNDTNFADDFARTAAMGREAGADIITANFSCPNVGKHAEGSVYTNAEAAEEITKKICREIKGTPLIIKLGYYEDKQLQKEILTSIARAGAQGVCGINTLGRTVHTNTGEPALGAGREKSGICGAPIRPFGLSFVRHARQIIDEEKLDLTLLGVGGIVAPEQFNDYLDAGATIALTATGMMWDPYIAMRWHEQHNSTSYARHS